MDAEDQDGFQEFVANRSTALLRTAVLLSGGDRHAAEDLLQNALVKVANRWRRIDEPEAYVRQVLYRQQISRWRLKGRRKEVSVAEPPDGAAGGDGTGAADLRLLMRGALARLTTRQRTVLVLRYFEDLPEAEVARALGCSVGTVRSTTHRSLARLRALAPELGDLEGSAEPRPPQSAAPREPGHGQAPYTGTAGSLVSVPAGAPAPSDGSDASEGSTGTEAARATDATDAMGSADAGDAASRTAPPDPARSQRPAGQARPAAPTRLSDVPRGAARPASPGTPLEVRP